MFNTCVQHHFAAHIPDFCHIWKKPEHHMCLSHVVIREAVVLPIPVFHEQAARWDTSRL